MVEIKTLIDEEKLHARIKEMAQQIEKEYEGREITLICILKGSVFFTVELAKNIKSNVKLEFIRVSSYGEGTESTGEIKMKLDLKDSIQGKDVIFLFLREINFAHK